MNSSGEELKPIRMHVNELPWGIQEGFEGWNGLKLDFKKVELNRYPDSSYRELRNAVGDFIGVKNENICLGNGSDELIGLIFMLLMKQGESILIESPTFGEYERTAELLKIDVRKVIIQRKKDCKEYREEDGKECGKGYCKECGVERSEDGNQGCNQEDIKEGQISKNTRLENIKNQLKVEMEKGKSPQLLVLCNPNNPTGELLTKEAIKEFMKEYGGYVLLDEAYIDFCQEESLSGIIEEFPKLIILRTFSKGFGLAGIRLGFSISSIDITKRLNEIRPPYNINGITEYVALEALKKTSEFRSRISKVIEERSRVEKELKNMAIPFIKSSGNFILIEGSGNWKRGYQQRLKEKAKEKNMILRFFNTDEIDGCFRFSLGKREENDELLEVLKNL